MFKRARTRFQTGTASAENTMSQPGPRTTPPGPASEGPAWWAAVIAVVVAGCALRVAGAWGEIWFDEIWTLNLVAGRAPTPFHVFWSVQHDNVHPLYGFYAWFMPDHPLPLLYRLPAVLLGGGTVVAAWLIGRRRSAAEALFAAVLAAFSYPMVHYGSEARGYGPMMFCVLAAFYLIERDLEDGASRRRAWVGLALVAAVLFHPTAALTALALGLWFVFDRWRETRCLMRAAGEGLRYFLFAIVMLLFLISVFAAAYLIHGFQWGDLAWPEDFAQQFAAQVGQMVQLLWGLPTVLPGWAGLGVVGTVAVAIITWLFRKRDRRAPFYGLALFGLMGTLFLASVPANVFGRYYLFSLVFLIPLGAQGLAGIWQLKPAGKAVSLVLLVIFLIGSAWFNALFLTYGRGDARGLLAYLAQEDKGAVVRLAADHKFRIETTFAYQARDVMPGKRLEVVSLKEIGASPPRWLIKHRNATSGADIRSPPARTIQAGGAPYVLVKVYPYWGLSGFQWALYRRAAPRGLEKR